MIRSAVVRRHAKLAASLTLLFVLTTAGAQDHTQHPAPVVKPAPSEQTSPAEPASPVDHSAMGHEMPSDGPQQSADHSSTDHEDPDAGEHTGHEMSQPPKEPIPTPTDADRAAAFPAISEGHAAHGAGMHTFLQFDQLETWREDDATGLTWEAQGWLGGDLHRLWARSEGEHLAGDTETADFELLYGRAVLPWWHLVGGVQHDFSPGPSQTFVGIGIVGLAPYEFEVEATIYAGEAGQTRAVLEAEYELLFTNRLILQPVLEMTFHGKDDDRRGIGSGLSTMEAGLRLRYEFTRRFAPYVGIAYERAFSHTAELRRVEGEDISDTVIVAGVRTWF
jgi:copper resistance protein B